MHEGPEVLNGQPPAEAWATVRDAHLDRELPGGAGTIRRTLWLEAPTVAMRFAEVSPK